MMVLVCNPIFIIILFVVCDASKYFFENNFNGYIYGLTLI